MKKNAIAALISAALAVPALDAQAAEVSIRGMYDVGLRYAFADDGVTGSTDALSMASGLLDGSRVSISAHEDISPELSVGFIGESGFQTDSGAFTADGTLFSLGSMVYVSHKRAGELWAGRIGTIRSGATPAGWQIFGQRTSPFGSGWDGYGAGALYAMPFIGFNVDNALMYKTPVFNGFQLNVEYSFGGMDGGTENTAGTDRYSAAALTYDRGPLRLVGAVEYINENSGTGARTDELALAFGGSMTAAGATLYGWAQWFRGADQVIALSGVENYALFDGLDHVDGWAAALSAKIPAGVGFVDLAVSYMDAEAKDDFTEAQAQKNVRRLKRIGVTAAYEHPLSKTTTLYTSAGVYKDRTTYDAGASDAAARSPLAGQLTAGVHINF